MPFRRSQNRSKANHSVSRSSRHQRHEPWQLHGASFMHPPPFESDTEWIAMVTHMKNTMADEVRNYDPNAAIVNEICRLCCNQYVEPYHTRWHLSCCGAPCGRLCLAIAMYHDNSHRCPFCFHLFPNFYNDNRAGTPVYDLGGANLSTLCDRYESHWSFATTKLEFPLDSIEHPLYRGKSFRNWIGAEFAPIARVEAVSKESFSVADLEPAGKSSKPMVSLGIRSDGSHKVQESNGTKSVKATSSGVSKLNNFDLELFKKSGKIVEFIPRDQRESFSMLSPIKEE